MNKPFLLTVLILFSLFTSCAGQSRVQIGDRTAEPQAAASPAATNATLPNSKPDADLQKQFERIAAEAKGKVGVYAVLLETGDTAGLNAGQHFPMQSVYKLPISMAVMQQVAIAKIK